MRQPVLVVDFGAHSTGAAVVVGDQATLIREPLTGALLWPSQLSVEGGVFYAGTARTGSATPARARGRRAPRALDSETVIPLGDRTSRRPRR